jgi:long-subunit acyl-CoA synthetase (AMP-forming)
MVTLSTFENKNVMVKAMEKAIEKALAGENKLSAPVSGKWTEVSSNEYESQVRQLAYGLMVKGYKRGESAIILDSASQAGAFIDAGCKLAHLNITGFSDSLIGEELISVLRDSEVRAIFVMNKKDLENVSSLINGSGLNVDLYSVLGSDSGTSLNYLQRIGATWELKYKPAVDRTLREISFNS